ncbi:hypothetical protein [Streptomyces sp. NPDC096033]|uniref:hypothetical protein n=1 Tax=Streptomyces sp. NPDC096033 TaxID=3366071 RepID=UPI0038223C89
MTRPNLHDRALDATAQALNAGGYWLPADGQAAVVDAVLAVVDAAHGRALDTLIAEAARIEGTTYRTHEGAISMSGVAAGLREAVRTLRPRSEKRDQQPTT